MRNAIATTLLAFTVIGCTDDPAGPGSDTLTQSAAKNAAATALNGFSAPALGSSPTSCPRSLTAVSDDAVAALAMKVTAAPRRPGAWTNDQASQHGALAVARVGTQANHARTHVNATGAGVITDPDNNSFPVRFAITAAVADDGAAVGHINFHFSRPFGQAWGVVPVDHIHLNGHVTSGEVLANETVVLEGTLTEREYVNGEGVVFLEENVPFRIAAGGALGAGALTLTWCLLPEFQIQVTNGTLRIH